MIRGDVSDYQACQGDSVTRRSRSQMEWSPPYHRRSRRVRRDPQFGYRSTTEYRENPPAYQVPPTTRAANSEATLKVLKMSYEGKDVETITVPLLRINAGDAGYDGLERSLGHIPNLWSHDVIPFKWEHRSLVTVSAKELGHQCKEDFYMYKCTNPRARLKANAHFDEPAGARIYGDAFVFKAEPDAFDMEEYGSSYTRVNGPKVSRFVPRATFVDIDGRFAESVSVRGRARKIVDELALKEA